MNKIVENILAGKDVRKSVMEKLYSTDDIQDILSTLSRDKEKKAAFIATLKDVNARDRAAIIDCIDEGWYEEFDRYDSAVCETFLDKWEKFNK